MPSLANRNPLLSAMRLMWFVGEDPAIGTYVSRVQTKDRNTTSLNTKKQRYYWKLESGGNTIQEFGFARYSSTVKENCHSTTSLHDMFIWKSSNVSSAMTENRALSTCLTRYVGSDYCNCTQQSITDSSGVCLERDECSLGVDTCGQDSTCVDSGMYTSGYDCMCQLSLTYGSTDRVNRTLDDVDHQTMNEQTHCTNHSVQGTCLDVNYTSIIASTVTLFLLLIVGSVLLLVKTKKMTLGPMFGNNNANQVRDTVVSGNGAIVVQNIDNDNTQFHISSFSSSNIASGQVVKIEKRGDVQVSQQWNRETGEVTYTKDQAV